MKKQIGIIGLGKMGARLALNLRDHGWEVVAFNRTGEVTKKYEQRGLIGAYSFAQLVEKLAKPRIVWLMVDHKAVDLVLFGGQTTIATAGLVDFLKRQDIVIDGGNSFYKDSSRRARVLLKRGIHFLDVGVSGGPKGARNGACCMIGGNRTIYNKLQQLFDDISIKDGYGYFGKSGAGHFVKMVHNGIEYAMMQGIAEGFEIISKSDFKLDLAKVARVYNHGSVIESRLIDWLTKAFGKFGGDLKEVSGTAAASGEGKWTVETAHELGVRDKVIHEALRARQLSKRSPNYQAKIISALRNMFGEHKV